MQMLQIYWQETFSEDCIKCLKEGGREQCEEKDDKEGKGEVSLAS